jgi:6-bladed beta-propeller
MPTAHRYWIASTLLAVATLPAGAQQRVAVPEKPRVIASAPVELFRVGAEEGESWELLSSVRSLAFDAQDNLYVLDSGNYRVLVFDRTGKFVRQIGKQGEGPGEITFALGMVLDAHGDVVVYDMGRGGFTLYGTDGGYKTTITGAQDSRVLGGSGLQAVPGGGIALRTTSVLRRTAGAGPGEGFSPPTGPQKAPIIVHPLTQDGTVRTLYEIEMPPPKVVESGSSTNRRVMVSLAPPTFSPPVGWGVLPSGGIAINNAADYAVQVLDASGRVQRVFSTGVKPRAVSNRDREQAREQRRETMRNPSGGGGAFVRSINGQTSFSFGGGGGGAPPSEAQIEESVREMEFAETVPLVRGLFTDVAGRIWVTRTSTENPTQDGFIDLLDHAGRYIGSLRDEPVPAAVSASGLAAYITRDELDVEQVVVKRLPADWK